MTDFLVMNANKCNGQHWRNPNISVSTGMFNAGQPSNISLTVRNFGPQAVRLNSLRATVCAANTLHGFNAQSILPSLRNSNPLIYDNVFPFPLPDYILPPGGSQTVTLPAWTPTGADVNSFANVAGTLFDDPVTKLSLHACIFASCSGSWPATRSDPPGAVTDDGALINWTNAVFNNFCNDVHHAQRNVVVKRLKGQGFSKIAFLSGSSSSKDMEARLRVRETPFSKEEHVDLLDTLRSAGHPAEDLFPAEFPAASISIGEMSPQQGHVGAAWRVLLASVLAFLRAMLGHSRAEPIEERRSESVRFAPMELRPFALTIRPDPDDKPGTVRIFDVVQFNDDETQGGLRVVCVQV
ncbi:hypothetical protein ABEG18_18420 [Alsobacter sp. KACC 23698]|uniref:CARDB domain-containing protein n=1 Tax=Alsobacter sp. KACC 23698 TaxID=3149229 RepID=A0AAU7JC16_9HYPH